MRRAQKEKNRNYTFQYIIKYMGRGVKGSIERVYMKDSNGNTVKVCT